MSEQKEINKENINIMLKGFGNDPEHWKTFGDDETPFKEGELKAKNTERGFTYVEFRDIYGQECTLQNSSLATQGAIWLGVNNTGPNLTGPSGKKNEDVGARMHLSRKQVEQLLPILIEFVTLGYINESWK